MKIGSQTNSLTNHILSRAVIGQPEPAIGMGATLLAWTDRHAATIKVVNGDLITVQEDTALRISGSTQDGSAAYEYAANPTGAVYVFKKQKNGTWAEVRLSEKNRWVKTGGYGLRVGSREEYRDPSF